MANIRDLEIKSVRTNSVSYKKLLSWEIENFEDWWSSRRVVRLEREQESSTPKDEENETEVLKNGRGWSHSPTMSLIIDGIYHEFEVQLL